MTNSGRDFVQTAREGPAMITIDASKARKEFSATLKAARDGERIVLELHGKKCAAVVSVEDLEMLQRIEDYVDARAARKALRDVEENGAIPWDDVKAEFGL